MKAYQDLPRACPGTAAQSQATPARRILVVDDDESIRQLSTEVLIDFGYHVDSAEDGAAAWQTLNADGYDLVITDQNMPRVTGIELLGKLQAARMDLPVILTTGSLPLPDFTQSHWLQPAATLLKPFTVEQLLGMVKAVLHAADDADGEQISLPSDLQRPPSDRSAATMTP